MKDKPDELKSELSMSEDLSKSYISENFRYVWLL